MVIDACPACGEALGPVLHQGVPDFEHAVDARVDFRRCGGCGLLLQAPVPTPEQLRGFYPADYRPHASSSRPGGGRSLLSRLKDVQASLLLNALRPHLPGSDGRVLELGCGSGHLLNQLARRGYTRLAGVDRNPRLAENFAGSAIAFSACDLETDELPVAGPFDAIVLSYVLEHFHDPARMLARCHALLAPGGRLLALTPSAASLCHRVFGRYWSGLHAPRHTQIFTPDSLRALAQRAGYSSLSTVMLTDPAGWALSMQNWIEARRDTAAPATGTTWYSVASLPAWYPVALLERALHRGQALVGVLHH